MTAGPVPAGSLPLAARAPGKCILFGEHAVVHGRPELVLAIDLAVQVGVKTAAPGRTERRPDGRDDPPVPTGPPSNSCGPAVRRSRCG